MNKTLGHLRSELENMTFERWSLEGLNVYVSEFLGFEVDFEKMETETSDFRVGTNLILEDDTLAYVDVYYLNDSYDSMVITEIGFDSDNMLNTVDFDKIVKGVQSE